MNRRLADNPLNSLRLGLAQINPTVGDLDGNANKIIEYIEQARDGGADLVSFPELAITGYPPEDLLLRPSFLAQNRAALRKVIAASRGLAVVVGFVDQQGDIFNAAAIISDGELVSIYHKQFLPNYGVFDENRYFQAGIENPVFTLKGVGIGVNICEDIWYPTGPTTIQCFADALLIVNINASPFHVGKIEERNKMLATRASDNLAIIAYTNQIGGQDELVFDGSSVVFDESGKIVAEAPGFVETLLLADVDPNAVIRARLHDTRRRQEKLAAAAADKRVPRFTIDAVESGPKPPLKPKPPAPEAGDIDTVRQALVLGTGDYARKNGFSKVVLGLSGGIDSALTALIAAEALGPANVIGVRMPSQYSSEGSLADAQKLADNLGIELLTVPIVEMYETVAGRLAQAFESAGDDEAGRQEGSPFENVQARLRGLILMGLSNRFGWMVLTTGNKSESATGYTTLYGDSVGGFGVLKDVSKTMVYELAERWNETAGRELIPSAILTKPPSAELRPDQLDSDSLPPYSTLDPILEAYIVEDRDVDDIAALGYDRELVKKIVDMVYGSEFKRRQMAPGVKVTTRAFGKDRRWPITNKYRS